MLHQESGNAFRREMTVSGGFVATEPGLQIDFQRDPVPLVFFTRTSIFRRLIHALWR